MWRSRLDIGAEDLVSRRCTLNDDELGRAGRFVKASDRDRFVAARGLLREVVGAYVGLTPSAVEFEYGPNGKPHLAGGAPGLGFNLSHSGDWAL